MILRGGDSRRTSPLNEESEVRSMPICSMSVLTTIIVLGLGAPSVSRAVPCAELQQSTGKAPRFRPPCEAIFSAEDLGVDDPGTARATTGGNDVVGAEITAIDSMVETSLAAPEILTTLSALGPGGTGPDGGLVQGCDFDTSGTFETLYCVEGSGGFFTVDTISGAQALVGIATVQQPDDVITGLASDPTTGVMYMVATSESAPGTGNCANDSGLYTIDLATGAATRIGTIPDLSCVIAAGFDNSGQLFAYGVVNDTLVSIDKATGNSTVIGPLGFNANFAQGMDFDAATDTCYLFAWNDDAPSGSEGQLRTCDTSTGSTSFVGTLGGVGSFSEISGAGIVAGNATIFTDDFETGDTSAWSETVP
jgi:hypothetical protein